MAPRATHEILIEAGGEQPLPPPGLAAAAQTERVRRQQAGTPMVVIDDKNLGQHATGALTIAGGAAPAPPPTSATSPGGLDELEWRDRIRSLRAEWAAAVEAIHDLEGRVASLRTRFYATDDPYVRDGQVKPAWDHALETLSAARDRARELELELDAVLVEGRRAGALPGWLREGIDLEPKDHPYERPDRREPIEGELTGEPVILDEGGGPGLTTPQRPRRYFIETWGCQMNELDSQRLAGQLMAEGILPTSAPEDADVILLNSCSVREKAAQKAYSRLGEYRRLKKEGKELLIGFCGCVAQQEGEQALHRLPELDFVIGPARVGELSDVLARRRNGERVVATGFPAERPFDIDAVVRDGTHKGMVTIIEGCNKRCTFCIVPTTRGPERCRPFAEVVAEVEHLVRYGFVEIELLGQTVNHWREPGGDLDFADLLDAVARVPGLRRLRFVTSYPRDFTARMVEQVGLHEVICPYVHLPVQSGSDRILRLMGRGYTVADYLRLADDLRAARTDLALSTDIIVGFPGETEEDFLATLALVERVRFSQMFAFTYSPRPGTAAPRLALETPAPDVANRRLQELLELQRGVQRSLNQAFIGREMEVLVTGWGKTPGHQTGRTTCHRIVHFEATSPAAIGSLVPVHIETGFHHSLRGTLRPSSSTFPAGDTHAPRQGGLRVLPAG